MIIDCPACNKCFTITDEEPQIRGQVVCPHCQKHFEVTWLFPLTIDFVEETAANPMLSIENEII